MRLVVVRPAWLVDQEGCCRVLQSTRQQHGTGTERARGSLRTCSEMSAHYGLQTSMTQHMAPCRGVPPRCTHPAKGAVRAACRPGL